MMKARPCALLLISLLLSFAGGYAQKNFTALKGRILSQEGIPVYATLELKNNHRTTLSDERGNFRIRNLKAGADTLLISAVEFQPVAMAVRLFKDSLLDLGSIQLKTLSRELQRVEVTSPAAGSYKSDYTYLATKTRMPQADLPQGVSTITSEKIKDRMDFRLKDAVDEASGVNNYSGYDEYTIRGFRADNGRLINGLRGYNTTFTSPLLVNVERIEVIKGPTSTLYGNCDPGGNINMVTKKPLLTRQGEIALFGGSWDHLRATGDITGPVNGSKTLLYRFNAGYDNSHSFRNELFARSYQLAPSLSFIPNDRLQLHVDFSFTHVNTLLDRGQPGFLHDTLLKSTPVSLMVSQPGDFLRESDLATSVALSYKLNSHISFNAGYLNYQTRQQVGEHGVHSFITPDSVNLYFSSWNCQTLTNTLTAYFNDAFRTGPLSHHLLVGYDRVQSRVNLDQQYFEQPGVFGTGSGIVGTFSLARPRYRDTQPDIYRKSDYQSDATDVDASAYSTQGVYLQDQADWKKWKLLIGLREEFYHAGDETDSSDDDGLRVFLPRIGLVYALRTDLSLYATYNAGFDPFEASSSTQVFDQPFKPVHSQLLEIGSKASWFENRLAASLAIYQLTLQNVAVNANQISNPNLFVQQGEDRSRGIEAEANGYILPGLSLSLSFAYCDARVTKSLVGSEVGSRVENAPLYSGSSLVKYTFGKGLLKGFGLLAGHSQVSRRTTLSPGLHLPGYMVVNAALSYARSHFSVACNLNNIFNRVYWIGAYNTVNKWPGAPSNGMIRLGYAF